MKIFLLIIITVLIKTAFPITDWSYWRDINSIQRMEYFADMLYLGTQNGLARVNLSDTSYQVFSGFDGFAGTSVSQLAQSDDYLWYSTYEGYLGRYDGRNFELFFDLKIENYSINDFLLLEDKIIVATNRGLIEIEILDNYLVGRIAQVIQTVGSSPRESIVHSLYMRNDTLWAGMPDGAAKASIHDDLSRPANWRNYPAPRAVTAFGFYDGDYIFGLAYQPSNSSLARFVGDEIDTFHTLSRTTRPINQIKVINDTLWIFGSSDDVGRVPAYLSSPGATFRWLATADGIASSYCGIVVEDDLYVGLRHTGLGIRNTETNQIDNIRFPAPSGNSYFSFAQGSNRVGVISRESSVNILDGGNWSYFNYRIYTYPDSDLQSKIRSILRRATSLQFDHNGDLWIGSWGYAIAIYKGDNQWRFLDDDNSMVSGASGQEFFSVVTDLCFDIEGNMWVTLFEPYHRYSILLYDTDNIEDGELWKIHSDWSPLPDIEKPTTIDVRNGRAWLGTDEGRILGIDWHFNLFDTLYTWYFYYEDEITGFRVNDIAIASNDHVWIATNFGLVRIEPEIDEVFPINLPSNISTEVRAVALDDWDNIWIATADGAAVKSSFSGEFTVFKNMYEPEAPADERSGLFSNNIYDIGIDPITQDVWFLAEGGIAILSREIIDPDFVDKVHVYPNPVNFRFGQRLTFSGLPANPYLAIYTTNGDPVVSFDPSATDFANRFQWNGENAAGNLIASGIYVYIVNSGDKVIKGTILVR